MASYPSLSPRLTSTKSSCSSALYEMLPPRSRKLHLLVGSTGPRDTSWAQALVVRLSKNTGIETRAIVDDIVPRLTQTIIVMQNFSLSLRQRDRADDVEFYKQQAFDLVEWADILVCVPLDADGIAKMLAGFADTFLGEVLRGWDSQKNVVLVPGMSTHMWSSATTKRQLNKLRRKWNWVRVITPILWHYEGSPNPKKVPSWNGFNEVLGIVTNQADLLRLGHDVEVAKGVVAISDLGSKIESKLPPEIWTLILDHAGDWELAKALGIYTNLPVPPIWALQPRDTDGPIKAYEYELEWAVLAGNCATICQKLSNSPPDFSYLPALVVKLVIRFALIEVLEYLEANRPDLFKAFDGTTLSTKASSFYPRTDVLDFWRKSKWFRDRHTYDIEAVDGASKHGHVRVLDWWWRQSGLPLRYTEAALEQASGRGHLLVLEWWRNAAAQDENIVLRPGRSILWATQYGQANVLKWWETSGIPIAHGDAVTKMASRWGQVDVLETWRRLKGDGNLIFDADVLITATGHQHVGVLEWWRRFAHGELHGMEKGRGPLVEFRACDIEDALEDGIGADGGKVRQWWARNGLDPWARNEEWLTTRRL